MQRTCDGSSASGLTSAGTSWCHCGASFDDTDRSTAYPHNYLFSYNAPLSVSSITSSSWPLTVYPQGSWAVKPLPPDRETLGKADLDALAKAYASVVKPGEKIVICVDSDVTQAQIFELAEKLDNEGIRGLIIRSARAGSGYDLNPPFPRDTQDAQLNILARIGFLWDKRPDLTLAELLAWFADPEWKDKGKVVNDDDFATVTEIHFRKVYGGIHGQSE